MSMFMKRLLFNSSVAALVAGNASLLLAGEDAGLAFDFTDQSAVIRDPSTPANNYQSRGIVSGGALVGPGGVLTYTSPSNKICRQSDGFYRYGAHNLYLNSAAPANQSITVVSGATYAVTITGSVSVTASGAATGTWTAGTNTFTAATTTLTLGSTSGSGTVHVYRTPAVTDYVATAGSPVYALPYEYDTSGNCLGLLVEEARTNLLTYSSQFDNAAWVKSRSTVSADATTAPNGLTHGDKIVEDNTAANNHNVAGAYSGWTNTTAYTLSVYAKAGERSQLLVQLPNAAFPAAAEADFNLSNGTINSTGAGATSATITSVGNGWYRLTVTATCDNTTAGNFVFYLGNGSGFSYDGDNTSGLYVWGAQLESGSFPTSPIITYGAAATRAADNISIATSAFPHSETAGSVYYQGALVGVSTASTLRPWTLCDGTTSEVIAGGYVSSAPSFIVNDGGVSQVSISVGTIADNVTYRHASAWEANNFNAAKDGTAGTLDTSGTLPTVTALYIGSRESALSHANGHIKAISYVPRRKDDIELAVETRR